MTPQASPCTSCYMGRTATHRNIIPNHGDITMVSKGNTPMSLPLSLSCLTGHLLYQLAYLKLSKHMFCAW
jgi:hypothetical protein